MTLLVAWRLPLTTRVDPHPDIAPIWKFMLHFRSTQEPGKRHAATRNRPCNNCIYRISLKDGSPTLNGHTETSFNFRDVLLSEVQQMDADR